MDSVFLSLLNMSFTASIVIIAVLAIRLLLKKAPKIFSYAIWAVVLFRLLCPLTFESAIGLLPSSEPIHQNIVYEAQPEINTGFEIIDNSVNEILPPATPTASVNPIQIWIFIGRIIWNVGIFAHVLYSVIQYALLKRKLIGAKPLKENIYLADGINSPFVMGFFKPKIYLPSSLPKSEYDFIIAHEKCHIKRLDHITRVLSFIALALHWFNPLVWLAYIVSAKDMEMSCDEAVMKNMDSDIRTEYSTSLLRIATGKKLIFATPLAFGEGDTKGRVKNVMKYKKPVVWVTVTLVLITSVLLVVFGTNGARTAETMKMAQNLSVSDVEKIELVTFPDFYDNSYALISEHGYGDIINLINQSSGTPIEKPEPTEGAGQYFYVTKKDGSVLTVGNIGNTYLQINNDYFEAEHDWLKKFSTFVGNAPVPDDFHVGKMLDTSAEEVDTSDPLAQFEQISMGTTKNEVREQFGEPDTYGNWRYDEIYFLEDAQITISYDSDNETDSFVEDVNINTHARLSLNDLITLSEKGEDLTWSDFEAFPYKETGSGLYIRVYEINDLFKFGIGGGLTDAPPMYMTLYAKTGKEIEPSIDIRYESVTDFISKHDQEEPLLWDLPPMVMIEDKLYLDTGKLSEDALFQNPEHSDFDGVITSTVNGNERPTKNNESNFGEGFGYKIIDEESVAIYINEEWYQYKLGDGHSSVDDEQNAVEIVGDPRLLTEEELVFFNDNYFDIMYEKEGYPIRFSEGTRMGDEVQLIYRGYDPETGDIYEMIEHIVTMQQEGEDYNYTSHEPVV